MKLHELPCLICGKQIQLLNKGNDDPATYPCVVGGTIEISFGHGSVLDDIHGDISHQALICDNCFINVRDRTRTVKQVQYTSWEEPHDS